MVFREIAQRLEEVLEIEIVREWTNNVKEVLFERSGLHNL